MWPIWVRTDILNLKFKTVILREYFMQMNLGFFGDPMKTVVRLHLLKLHSAVGTTTKWTPRPVSVQIVGWG
jgi:hypothetical protein